MAGEWIGSFWDKDEAKAKSFGGVLLESADAKRTCKAIEPISGTNL